MTSVDAFLARRRGQEAPQQPAPQQPIDGGRTVDQWLAGKRASAAGPSTTPAAPRYGSFKQGMHDAIGGTLQTIVRGVVALAPNSQFAKDARAGGLAALDQQIAQTGAQYDAAREQRGEADDIDWGRTGGAVVGGLPFALGGGVAKTAAGRIATGGLAGAYSAGSSPVVGAQSDGDFWTEKGKQAAGGAVVGAAVPGVLGRFVGGTAKGSSNEAARRLAKDGVKLTPGQILGGTAKFMEGGFKSEVQRVDESAA